MSGLEWGFVVLLFLSSAGLNFITLKANEITMKELRRIWDEMRDEEEMTLAENG